MTRIFVWLLATVFLATFSLAAAQPTKVPRIAFLSASPSIDPAFLDGLRNLGYVGKTIVIELRSAEGKLTASNSQQT